jgi:hypothetical protein
VGRTAITEVAQSFMTAFPDLRLIMDELRVQADGADYHWMLIGTNTGPGGARHRMRISGFKSWRIGEDGLIASSQDHFDAADYQRQLEGGARDPATGGIG